MLTKCWLHFGPCSWHSASVDLLRPHNHPRMRTKIESCAHRLVFVRYCAHESYLTSLSLTLLIYEMDNNNRSFLGRLLGELNAGTFVNVWSTQYEFALDSVNVILAYSFPGVSVIPYSFLAGLIFPTVLFLVHVRSSGFYQMSRVHYLIFTYLTWGWPGILLVSLWDQCLCSLQGTSPRQFTAWNVVCLALCCIPALLEALQYMSGPLATEFDSNCQSCLLPDSYPAPLRALSTGNWSCLLVFCLPYWNRSKLEGKDYVIITAVSPLAKKLLDM